MTATMRRFHDTIPGEHPLYHGYCAEHPEFEIDRCGTAGQVGAAVDRHNIEFHLEQNA